MTFSIGCQTQEESPEELGAPLTVGELESDNEELGEIPPPVR